MTKIDRAALRQKIQQLEGLTDEERAALMELAATKRYGLVWEKREEAVEERLREELPVLIEDKELAILPRLQEGDGGRLPNHILIEGDNLEALTALSYTHEGKVDVIYIDPPYNTGNKDFVYNDSFVDSEDSYRHSKWLSFMSKRLRIAKRLLSDRGVIFISIDDNEQANLKLLCDEVFGEDHFVASPVRKRRDSQANLSKNISTIHEYVLIYRNSLEFFLNKVSANIDLNEYKNPDNDIRGPYKTMPCTNRGGTKYSILSPVGTIIEDEWRFTKDTFEALRQDNRIVFPRNGLGKPRYKLFLSEKKASGVIDNSWWDEWGTNQEGASLLKNIVEEEFNNPKPVELITHILDLASNNTSTVLDFFAGSGTTLHAVMQLNKEDGGKRQCILVTNNENNICREVTYERNKRVIEGYTTPKGVQVEGLHNNNLRYYRTHLLPRERTNRNMRALVNASTDLLCIKENIYNELKIEGIAPRYARMFGEGEKRMIVIYDERVIPHIVGWLQSASATNAFKQSNNQAIKVYVFSPGAYAWDDDFAPVIDKVELCALPEAIYQAYKSVLPKKRVRREITEGSPKDNYFFK